MSRENEFRMLPTEDDIFIFDSTFEEGSSLSEVLNENIINSSRNVYKLGKGENLDISKITNIDSYIGLLIEYKNGIKRVILNVKINKIKDFIYGDVRKRGIIIFNMDSLIDMSDQLQEHKNNLISQYESKLKNYFDLSEFAEIIGVTGQTLRNWDKSGKLKPELNINDTRRYSYTQLLKMMERKKALKLAINVQYEGNENLGEKALEFIRNDKVPFKDIKIVDINYKNFYSIEMEKIIRLILSGDISKVYVKTNGNNSIMYAELSFLHMICRVANSELELV